MAGTATYQQPLSRTMKHNVNVIMNDNEVVGDNTPISNTSGNPTGDNLFTQVISVVQNTGQEEQAEEAVLYENIDTNQSTGLKVTWRPWTSVYDIELFFHGRNRTDKKEFTFEPHEFSKIVIEQNFIERLCDHISVVVTLTPAQALLLLDNYRNLRAHIYIRRFNPDTEYIDKDYPLLDQDYMVILKDKELRKRISKQAFIPNHGREYNDEHHNQNFDGIELQLFTEKEYELKNKQFHFILTQATVKDAICYALKELGIEKMSLPEPDNKTTYTNLIIPPQQSFKTFIDFLQDRYGIYNEGCNFYYNEEIMFIYPDYKRTVTNCPETAHFYCIGDGNYESCKFFHAKDQNNMYHIVINKTPTIKELIDSGTENYGNRLLIQHSDKLLGLHSVIGEGKGNVQARMGMGEIDVNKDNTTFFSWDGDDDRENPIDKNYGIINNPYLEHYISTANMLKYKSSLKSYRGTLCGFEWTKAEPYFLRPGYAVKWHIDGERDVYQVKQDEVRDTMEYKTYDGIARGITYTLIPAGTPKASRYPFSCNAVIMLDLDYLPAEKMPDPAETITNEYTDVSLQTDSAYANTEKYDASASNGSTTSKKNTTYSPDNESDSEARRQQNVNNKNNVVYRSNISILADGRILVTWTDGSKSIYDKEDDIPEYKPKEKESTVKDLFSIM